MTNGRGISLSLLTYFSAKLVNYSGKILLNYCAPHGCRFCHTQFGGYCGCRQPSAPCMVRTVAAFLSSLRGKRRIRRFFNMEGRRVRRNLYLGGRRAFLQAARRVHSSFVAALVAYRDNRGCKIVFLCAVFSLFVHRAGHQARDTVDIVHGVGRGWRDVSGLHSEGQWMASIFERA